ncbi:MAG: hypothetical protein ABI609_10160 [Acidobacteriota bacterium]
MEKLPRWLEKPGFTDLGCAVSLLGASWVAATLEPTFHDFWLQAPLFVEIPLVCTGLLQRLPFQLPSTVARVVHLILMVAYGLGLALAALMLVSILFAGMAVILGPACALLATNSWYTLRRIAARRALALAPA